MRHHLPSGKLCFVEGWQPTDDPTVVVLIFETKSITPEIESSLFTAEVIRDTELIDLMHSGTLDGLHSLLREHYGDAKTIEPGYDVFAEAARILKTEELVGV